MCRFLNTFENLAQGKDLGETTQISLKPPLDRLDSWIDALKDLVLVPVGVIASYFALVHIESVNIVIAIAILTVSVFSTIFVPYKIALIKSNELGIFTRLRALTMMALVAISWSIPSVLILSNNTIAEFFIAESQGNPIRALLLPSLALLAAICALFMKRWGVRWLLRKAGMNDIDLRRNLNYPWSPSFVEFNIVSLFVIQAQIELLKGVSNATTNPIIATNHYTIAFGALLLLTIVLCFYTNYEPKRSWTGKGRILSVSIIIGALLAFVHVVVGFIVSFISIIVLEIYSSRLPEIDIDGTTLRAARDELGEQISIGIYKAIYPKLFRVTSLIEIAGLVLLLLGFSIVSMIGIFLAFGIVFTIVGNLLTKYAMKKSILKFTSPSQDEKKRFLIEMKKLFGSRYNNSVDVMLRNLLLE